MIAVLLVCRRNSRGLLELVLADGEVLEHKHRWGIVRLLAARGLDARDVRFV